MTSGSVENAPKEASETNEVKAKETPKERIESDSESNLDDEHFNVSCGLLIHKRREKCKQGEVHQPTKCEMNEIVPFCQ